MKKIEILLAPDAAAGIPAAAPAVPAAVPADELQHHIEKARLEERTKLRSEMEALNGRVASAQAELDRVAAQAALVAKSKTPTGEVDVNALIAETSKAVTAATQKAFEERMAKSDQEIAALRKRSHELELAEARSQAIKEAGGEAAIFTALVGGETVEAIRASVVRAKEEREKAMKALRESLLPGNAPASVPALPPPAPAPSAGPSSTTTTIGSLPANRRLTPSEWAKVRSEELRKTQEAHS